MRLSALIQLFFIVSTNMQALSFVVTPENTVVVFKDPRGAVLKCSVSTNVSVDWLFYDINGTAGSPCYVYKDAESAGGYDMCTDVSRFSVQPARSSDSSVAFDLVILRALYSDAGTYVCVESNSGRQAAALLGVIVNPGADTDDIQPRIHVITGGTTVFVTLASARFSKYRRQAAEQLLRANRKATNVSESDSDVELIITMTTTYDTAAQSKLYSIAPISSVSNASFTVLTFVLPLFDLPGEFANFTDPSLKFPFNSASSVSRRRKSLTGVTKRQAVAMHMVRSRRSVSVIDTEINSTLEFHVQLRLYGYYIYPWNLSSELRFINVLPIIHNTGVQLFDSEKVVNINGAHLNRGITLPSDYTVTIGNKYCIPVGELSYNLLTCRPPAAESSRTDIDSSFCDDNYAILVSVSNGTVSLGIAGCLRYNGDDGSSVLIYVLAGAASLLLLLLLLIALAFAVRRGNCARRERRSDGSRQHSANNSNQESRFTEPT